MSCPPEISASLSGESQGKAACRLASLATATRQNTHFVLTAILVGVLIPAFHRLGLPVRFNWSLLAGFYWPSLATQSLFAAVLLYLIGFDWKETFRPVWDRHLGQKPKLLILAVVFLAQSLFLGLLKAILISVVTIGIVEFVHRKRGAGRVTKSVVDVLFPAAYLFIGFIVVFSYNDIIARVRFYGAYDEVFNRMDSRIFFGATVSGIAHSAIRILPPVTLKLLEFFYYGMFAQIGAGLVICALYFGRNRSLQFVGTILVAYYLALAIFFLWPSQGPFYLCAHHFAEFPHELKTYGYQKQFLINVKLVWEHGAIQRINTDYYIAFPCMHIALPLIVAWFLRRWRRMVAALLAYDTVMVVAILVLEWHYMVDLAGGIAVAFLAIAIVNPKAVAAQVHRRSLQTAAARP